MTEKAVGYCIKAGQQAVARSAMIEAVTQLRRGLDLLALLPDGVERRQYELDLKVTLAAALVATRGYTAPEVAGALRPCAYAVRGAQPTLAARRGW